MFNYSAIATVYNDQDEIKQLIDDVINQELPPQELIVVDGGSTDETVKLIKDYKNISRTRIICISGERLNVSQGLNKGIDEAISPYIAIVAVGNRHSKNYFRLLSEAIDKDTLDYAYSPIWGQDTTRFAKLYNRTILKGTEGVKLAIPSNHGVVISRGIFSDIGHFYEYFIFAGEDLELYDLLVKSKYVGKCVNEARVYWDTPHNFKEYNRQVKNYAIASMQIYNLSKLIKSDIRNFLYLITLITSIIFTIIIETKLIGSVVLVVILSCNIFLGIRKGFKYVLLKNYSFASPYFYMIKYFKYFSAEYRVERK